jgi:hypothetical protein
VEGKQSQGGDNDKKRVEASYSRLKQRVFMKTRKLSNG